MKWTTAAILIAGLGACADHQFEPPDRSARVERVAASFDPALFDSISWGSQAARTEAGNEVYAAECRRCHGTLGQGDADYGRARGLAVPSLVEPDWPLASLDSIRHRIYVGHEAGMPVFGERNLTPREIDAAAAYVLLTLRPDVLQQQ